MYLREDLYGKDEIMKEDKLPMNSDSIISVTEIRNILSNYRIGKKPLAKLLGWGETTIIRYIEGDIPTAEYSSRLRTIGEEPSYYYELLLKNKDKLTNVAFRKSKNAVLNKMLESKISLISQYIVMICDADVSPAYIQWLVYYCQAFSLALYDKELIEEEYCANIPGIPFEKLYNSMKKHVTGALEVPEDRLTEQEVKLVNKVVNSFLWYGPKGLKALGSEERSKLKISRDKEGNRIISKDTIKNYFKEILVKYDINCLDDINKYPDIHILQLKN